MIQNCYIPKADFFPSFIIYTFQNIILNEKVIEIDSSSNENLEIEGTNYSYQG